MVSKSWWNMSFLFFIKIPFLIAFITTIYNIIIWTTIKNVEHWMNSPMVKIVFLMAGIFLALYSSTFFAYTVQYHLSSSTVRYKFVYYILGFIGQMIFAFSAYAQKDPWGTSTTEMQREDFTLFHWACLLLFVVFSFSPTLMESKFLRWFNHWYYD